jgi:hypothetical protein
MGRKREVKEEEKKEEGLEYKEEDKDWRNKKGLSPRCCAEYALRVRISN